MINVTTNSNKDFVREFRKKLKENEGYCPCSLIKNKDTKCMCKEFREQIANGIAGECHCGLFIATTEE